MRGLFVFLAALGLGALTVPAQEPTAPTALELAHAARDLSARLRAYAEGQRRAAGQVMLIRRSYDIGDLTQAVAHVRLTPSNLAPGGRHKLPGENDLPDPGGAYEVDQVIELIRGVVAPETWETVEGAEMEPRGRLLFVAQIAEVHTRIGKLLDQLRAQLAHTAMVDIEAVAAPQATVDALHGHADAAASATALADAPRLGRLRLHARDGIYTAQRAGQGRTYVADYEVEIASTSTIGQAEPATVFSGLGAEVRVGLDLAGKRALVALRCEWTAMAREVRTLPTEHGPLELPEMRLARLGTTLVAPLGVPVVAGGGTHGGQPCIFVVTVRTVGG